MLSILRSLSKLSLNCKRTTDLKHPYNKIGDGPEGPEARVVADKLKSNILYKYLHCTYLNEKSKITDVDNIKYPSRITNIFSYGKKIIIELHSGFLLITSLGMTGKFTYTSGKHSNIKFDINDVKPLGKFNILHKFCDLYYDDTRNFGNIVVIHKNNSSNFFNKLGPDLLQASITPDNWISFDNWLSIFTHKKLLKKPICIVLMNQELIAGIGNYLKSEILYLSGVHPERLIESITIDEWKLIHKNAHVVINTSYSHQGFTIESFISPDGTLGTYPSIVYGKKIDPYGNQVVKIYTKDKRCSYIAPLIQKI
jgi:formamidopyrimidine-DNA glycosylase